MSGVGGDKKKGVSQPAQPKQEAPKGGEKAAAPKQGVKK